MKKIITLMLALAGMVYTASADEVTNYKTIYVENSRGWSDFYLHRFGSSKGNDTTWPGDKLNTKVTIDGKDIYTVELKDCTGFQLHNNTGDNNEKSNDMTSSKYTNGAYYWMVNGTGTKAWIYDDNDEEHNAEMTLYTNVTYTINVKSDNTTWTHCIYAFNDDNSNVKPCGAWSGENQMTGCGNDIYTYTFTLNKTFLPSFDVIINNNHLTEDNQSDKITITPGTSYLTLSGKTLTKSEGVTTNSSGYTTYVNGSAVNISGPKAYYATDRGNGCAWAHAITNPLANTPMLIKGTPNTIYFFVSAPSGESYDGNAFKAGDVTTAESLTFNYGGGYNYILKGDAFYKANNNIVPTNKAYLHLSAPASARPLIFPGEEDEETGISAIVSSAANTDAYYNLRGQRVTNPSKGLYIVNGRKVVLK